MTLPFSLPDWAPPWLGFVVLVVGVLFALAFLVMPFSVFGVKGRLDGLEARLDEIQREIRLLALRLPEPVADERLPIVDEAERRSWADQPNRPPIPPRAAARLDLDDRPAPSPGRRVQAGRGVPRAEPRFD